MLFISGLCTIHTLLLKRMRSYKTRYIHPINSNEGATKHARITSLMKLLH